MPEDRLTSLRRSRVAVLRSLERLQPLVARDLARLAEIDAQIRALAPEPAPGLREPARAPQVVITQADLLRSIPRLLRRAGEPLPIGEITLAVLAARDVPLPGPELWRQARQGVRQALAALAQQGRVTRQGHGRGAKWHLLRPSPRP